MKLNYSRTFFIGCAFLSICAFWQMYDSVIPLILKDTFHLGETATGVIMALDNVLALFLLPLFGALSDKTDTKLGKRTPYIVIGTFAAAAFMVCLPIADKHYSFVWFVICLGVVLMAMGSYRSPAVALMPDFTPKPLRSKANAVINLMGAVGGVFALVAMKLFIPNANHPDYTLVFVFIAVLMVLAVVVLLLTVNEKKLAGIIPQEAEPDEAQENGKLNADVKKSMIFLLASVFFWFTAYNAVTSAFTRYAKQVWKLTGGDFADCLLVATIAAVISFIPIGILSVRFGRKPLILSGILLMVVAYSYGFIFPKYSPAFQVAFAVIGIGWAAINVNSYPMVVEMAKGSNIGKMTGLYYTFSMAAQILTPILSGFLLEKVNYSILFPYAALFSAISAVTMLFVKHGDNRAPKKSSILEHFDVED